MLLLAGLAAISGIFYPITHLPVFLQRTGQAGLPDVLAGARDAFCSAAERDGGRGDRPLVAGNVSSEVIYDRIAMLRAERGIFRCKLADALGMY